VPSSLLTALRDHLVTAGLVRKPSVPGALVPLWLEPQLGTPAPGEGNNPTEVGSDLVIGAFLTGGFAPEPFASYQRRPIIDLRFRGRTPQNIETTELAITKQLIDRRDFMLGAPGNQLHIIECEQWRALQRLGSDEQGFEYVTAFWFELARP
jgi:hypothetical protein